MTWWTESRPRSRRLALARRIPLRERVASRVPLEPPRLSRQELLARRDGLAVACTLVFGETISEASQLEVAARAETTGTVRLDRESREGVVSTRNTPRAPTGAARQRPERDQGDRRPAGVPLGDRLRLVLQPPLEGFLGEQGIVDWPHSFFDFQRDGIRALVAHEALLLADDMGLGKTVQTAAALRILFRLRRIEHALLVVPASLILQWRRALHEWAPELRTSTVRGTASERAHQWQAPVHVYLTSYETLRSDLTDNPSSPPRRRIWDVVVLDEAQRIKNRDSAISQACKRLPRARAWALTGTPLENRIDDLASICEFLQPWQDGQDQLRLTAGPELLERHRALQLRRKKRDVLTQLPPKTSVGIELQLAGEQLASYQHAERDGILRLKGLGESVRITHVLELITRLKQICNICPHSGQSAKLDDIESRLAILSEEEHKALIFSQYANAHGVRDIVERLQRFGPVSYTGALSMHDRDRAISEFKSDPSHRVLVLSLQAGGQGLNLQEASYVFHFDRWWNPAVENQAEDRSHRLGQTSPVTVYTYTCAGTIEERIDAILREKQALFDLLIDDVSIDLETSLTGAELFRLFDLEPPSSMRARVGEPPRHGGMSGEEFERYLGDILRRLGWSVEPTQRSRDGGIDLKAAKTDMVGIETRFYVQCKNQAAPVSVEVVRELSGVLDGSIQGVVAAPGGFKADARSFAAARGIQLWDEAHIAALLESAGSVGDS